MSFKTLVSISKNDESDIKVLGVVVTSDISVSAVAATEDGELLLILAGFATIFDEDLIFLYEAYKYLSTCSFDEVFSLVLADLVYRLPWNLRLVYSDEPLFRLREAANFCFLFPSISV